MTHHCIINFIASRIVNFLARSFAYNSDPPSNAGFCFEANNIPEVLDEDMEDDLAEMLQSMSLEEEPYFEEDLECYAPFNQDIVNYVFIEYECTESNEELEDDG